MFLDEKNTFRNRKRNPNNHQILYLSASSCLKWAHFLLQTNIFTSQAENRHGPVRLSKHHIVETLFYIKEIFVDISTSHFILKYLKSW